MTVSDLGRVVEIARLSSANPWSRGAFEYELESSPDRSRLLVTEHNGTITGYIVYWLIEDAGEILDLAVAPRFRRKGIARGLVRGTIVDMEGRGARMIHLEVRPSNVAALALYRHYGFEKAYVRPAYYDKPREDAWVLRLSFRSQFCPGLTGPDTNLRKGVHPLECPVSRPIKPLSPPL